MVILGKQFDGWFWYLTEEHEKLDKYKCGKWMYFFDNQEFAKSICEKAIKNGVCWECKCTDMVTQNTITGVLCFYLNGDDISQHKSVIEFMIQNDLIRKTKAGRYYNNSFNDIFIF